MNSGTDCVTIAQIVLSIFNVFATLGLSTCLVYYASKQTRLAAMQAKLMAFERRIALYDSIRVFLAHITQHSSVGEAELVVMLRETKHAEFLFPAGSPIIKMIDELYSRGRELEHCVNSYKSTPTANWNDLSAHQTALIGWFKGQREEVSKQFRPYLAVEDE